MMSRQRPKIGFACAYTALTLIDAAGFIPYRLMPMTESADLAGSILHDNLCPHVKCLLDRAIAGDLPQLAAVVFVNSCDAMRRLSDAWQKARPKDPVVLIDLPATQDERAVSYLAGELSRLASTLFRWSGKTISAEAIKESIKRYNVLSSLLTELRKRCYQGQLQGGSARLQSLSNLASTAAAEYVIARIQAALAEPELPKAETRNVPIFLFGQVLPDPEAFSFLESCGARLVGDDLCTGSRLLAPIDPEGAGDLFHKIAFGLLRKPACARTIDPADPIRIAEDTLKHAVECDARGAIGYTLKFCDLYLTRLPTLRDIFRDRNFPLLLLEGDCTLRSIGQQRTRMEAFIEMLR